MKKIFVILLLSATACSTQTLYNVDLDLLSFLDEFELEQSITFPPSFDLSIYLFPEVELSTGGPGELSQQGILISFPPQEIVDMEGFSVKLEMEIEIKNNSPTEQISGDRISLYIASPEAGNIYTDGVRVDLVNIENIFPLESSVFVQEYYLEEDGILLEIIRKGEFRLGVAIQLTSSAHFIPLVYSITRIELSTAFSSMDLLSLGI